MSARPNPIGYQCVPFRFSGRGAEYFRIWIVNICLSIITLGIYSAWAKVRNLRYFYSNTSLNGHNFAYLADPVKILKGRLIAVAALAAYFTTWEFFPRSAFIFLVVGVLLMPAIIILALSFTLRNSAYRNIRFTFERDFVGIYKLFGTPLCIILGLTWIGYSLLESSSWLLEMEEAASSEGTEFIKEDMIISIFMLVLIPAIPYLDYLRTRFVVDHSGYGTAAMGFQAGAWPFYKVYLLTLLAFIGLLTVVSFISGFLAVMIFGISDPEKAGSMFGSFFIVYMFLFYGLGLFVLGFNRALRTNLIFSNIEINESRLYTRLGLIRTGWIYFTNALAIIASLGMLIPWAKVRMARYVADCTELESEELDRIAAAPEPERSAIGEELSEAFDIDVGI